MKYKLYEFYSEDLPILGIIAPNIKEARKYLLNSDIQYYVEDWSYIEIVGCLSLRKNFKNIEALKKIGYGNVSLEEGVKHGIYDKILVEEMEGTCDICYKKKCTTFYGESGKLICYECKRK